MSATAFPKPALRPMLPSDAGLLVAIFQDSIDTLTEEDYDEGQRAAWAAMAEEPSFLEGLAAALTLVATVGGSPVGFVSMEATGTIAQIYVHPALARQGVGSLLYDAIAKLADARRISRLTVDASDTAKPFFEAKGFAAQHRQTVQRGDIWIGETRMTKDL